MNKVFRISLLVTALLVVAAALLLTGYFFGRNARTVRGFPREEIMPRAVRGGRMGYGSWDQEPMRPGMMGGGRPGHGRGRGMMGGFPAGSAADPLSVSEAQEAVEDYLDAIQAQDLVLDEIMIFSNHAYAIVVEESSEMGAFELLVDPVTKEVVPEYGPNMMWNLKYGMMRGSHGNGRMGPGMMGGKYGSTPGELSISPEEARQAAQRYLDEFAPGTEVSDETTTFYGYYTIDVERGGEITGMVSVNGFTSQVFPHTWHGEFIEMHHE